MFGEKIVNLDFMLDRFNALSIIWENVKVIGSGITAIHPVFKILQNDMKFCTRYNRRIPVVIKGTKAIAPRKRYNTGEDEDTNFQENDDEELDNAVLETEEFKLVVSTFENEYNIDKLVA